MDFSEIWKYFKILMPALLMVLVGIFGLQYADTAGTREAYDAAAVGDWAHAAELFEAEAPKKPELWEQAGRAAWQAGDMTQAEASFMTALQENSIGFESLRLWMDYLYSTNRSAAAVSYLEGYLLAGNNAAETYMILAEAYERNQQMDLALQTWQSLLESEPLDPIYSFQAGRLLLPTDAEHSKLLLNLAASIESEIQEEALAYQRLLDDALAASEPAHTYVLIGQDFGAKGAWMLAEQAFYRAISLNANYAEAWAFLGESLFQNGRDGTQALKNALKLDPYSFSANLLMGIQHRREARLDRALEYFEFASELEPLNANVIIEIAQTQVLQDELEQAFDNYQKAVSLSPYSPRYHILLGKFSLDYDYYLEEAGLSAAEEAQRLKPDSSETNLLLGRIHFALGNLEEAQTFLQAGLMAEPSAPLVHYHLGLLYLEVGDYPVAEAAFNTVVQLAPLTSEAEKARQIIEKFLP